MTRRTSLCRRQRALGSGQWKYCPKLSIATSLASESGTSTYPRS
jgi:hypothetical protein